MKKLFKISFMVLLSQTFFQELSMAMDPEESKKISFSAHQQVFKQTLEELGQDITKSIGKFPTVFIAYGWGDKDNKEHQEHAQLVDALVTDLKLFGFPIDYDLDVRCGGKDNIHTHADKILTVDKVILIGSPHLKEKYDEQKGVITEEIDLLRQRIRNKKENKLPTGVVPVWFNRTIEENFPEPLLRLPARTLEKRSLIDIGYFSNFFELLLDIFHTESNAGSIGESVKTHKKGFIETSGEITPEILQEYGLQIRVTKEEKTKKHTEKLRGILGLNGESVKKK